MQPTKFTELAFEKGQLETYSSGQVFHSQDFPNKLFVIKTGYVKRYQARDIEKKVLELIYGPKHVVSLSRLYKRLFGVDQNQDQFIYIYQAMTDVELYSLPEDFVVEQLEKDPLLYRDFFYESGLKLRANIFRLASNSLHDTYQRVAHQLVSLAYEFCGITFGDNTTSIALPLPHTAIDLSEQLHMTVEEAEAALAKFTSANLIKADGAMITILDVERLKDIYLH